MKHCQDQSADAAKLRRRAEERLGDQRKSQRSAAGDRKTAEETTRLVHELQVHQIELEMQNEELRQATNELETALERYTELCDFALVGYLTLQPDSTMLQVNLTAASWLGIERSHLLNRRFSRYVTAEDRSAFAALLARAFKTKASEVGEVRLLIKGKPPLTVQFRAWISGNGQECRVVLTDFTERKRAEAALRQSEARYAALFEHNPIETIVVDLHGRIQAFNRAKRESGHRLPQIGDVMYRDYAGKHTIDMHRELMHCIQSGESQHYPEQPYGERILSLDIAPFADGAIITSRDITERKRTDVLRHIEHYLARALINTSRLKEGLRICFEAALKISGMKCGGFYLVDKTSGALDLAFHQGLSSDFVKAVAHYAADSAHAKLVMAGQPVYSEHPALGVPLSETERREGLRAIAVVPVSHEGQVIACLNIASPALGEVPAFARNALETVVAQTGNAIVRLQAEEELRSIAKFPSENPYPVLRLSRAGTILYANKAGQGLLWDWGCVVGNYAPMFWRDLVTEALTSRSTKTVDIQQGEQVLSFFVAPIIEGSYVNLYGRDITQHKRAEEALALQKRIADVFLTVPDDEMYDEVLKVILEVMQSPHGVFGYMDNAGALVAPTMARHIWDKCQIPDKTFRFPRDTWGDGSWPRAIGEKRTIYSNEASTQVPAGHISIRRHISVPILFQGEVIGLLMVANRETDYTAADRRALETIAEYIAPVLSARLQRQRREEELELRNDELIRFTYTVSHDLKSPVVTIRAFLGYLEQDSRNQDAARVAKDLDYMRTAADKMSRLLDELLELSRVGHKVNPSGEAPLQAIVNEALALVAGRIAQRGVQVQVTEEPIRLYGDHPRLVQVFQNLVENAVKFMGDQPAPRVEIGVEQDRDKIVLFVRDNGIGIDPRYQSKLFGLFEKLDPATEGTGIGLALVRRIVEVHDGQIWVESEGLGKGAVFCFTLGKTVRREDVRRKARGEGRSVGIVRSGKKRKKE